jgi:uncharacterized membrane protein YebE (DUF533 family)
MFNASDLLGTLLQGGGPRGRSTGRLEHAMGDRGLGGAGGPLGQILGGMAGGPRGGEAGGHRGGAGGGDVLGSLAGMLGGGGAGGRSGFGGGLSGGGGRPLGRDLMMGGLGALAASVLAGRGRGHAMGGGAGGGGLAGGNLRGAVGAGGLALLGMLAMNALRNTGNRPEAASLGPAGAGATASGMDVAQGTAGDGASSDAMPPEEAVSDRTAGLVLRAMIAAAKADGRVDATERQRIVAKAQEGGADQEAVAFLEQELARPADPDSFAAEAARDPVVAAQVYGASLLAIQLDTPEERDYLRALAGRLGLQPAVAAQLHGALGAPPP